MERGTWNMEHGTRTMERGPCAHFCSLIRGEDFGIIFDARMRYVVTIIFWIKMLHKFYIVTHI